MFKIQLVRNNVTGEGRSWFLSGNFTWMDLKNDFCATFIRTPSKVDQWDLMKQRVQGRNERVYFHDKYRLCMTLGLSIDDVRDQITQGLYSGELSLYL